MTEAQKCLYHIAENMRMDKSISKEGYEYFQQAIKALEQEPCVSEGVCREDKIQVLDKIRAEITDWQNDIHDNEYDAENHDFVFERIFEIFDENKAESEDKK